MNKLLLSFFALFFCKSPLASEPLYISSGNGHRSAIYHSEEFDLRLADKRLLQATNNGRDIKINSDVYKCEVTKYGHSWGSSEMGLDCKGSKKLYIRILAEVKADKIKGLLVMGPNADVVQVELNWMNSRFKNQPEPSVSIVGFTLVRHTGWLN